MFRRGRIQKMRLCFILGDASFFWGFCLLRSALSPSFESFKSRDISIFTTGNLATLNKFENEAEKWLCCTLSFRICSEWVGIDLKHLLGCMTTPADWCSNTLPNWQYKKATFEWSRYETLTHSLTSVAFQDCSTRRVLYIYTQYSTDWM